MPKPKPTTASTIPVHCSYARLADVTTLVPNPRNPNKHSDKQVALLAKVIRHQGWRAPITVSKRSGFIVTGHGRLAAALLLQVEQVPIDEQDFASEADEWAHLVADNRLAELADADRSMIADLLKDLDAEGTIDMDLTGFDMDALDELLAETNSPDITEDEVPDVPVDPITQSGDLWILGDHRVMCGDSTKAEDVARLMDGNRINVAFTSPPYASQRIYDQSSGFKPIDPDKFVDWWENIQRSIKDHIATDGSFFINIKPACEGLERYLYVFDLVIAMKRKWGWLFCEEFCWERSGIPQKVVRRFKNQFEPIYQFALGEWKFNPEDVRHESQSIPQAMGKGAGDTNAARRQGKQSAVEPNEVIAGLAYPGNRLPTLNSTHTALGHSAAFPVGLPSFFIRAYSDNRDNIYEPFCGSGSTLIAAEQLGRKCYGMEISPAYCDVIVRRWENLTGKQAVLSND